MLTRALILAAGKGIAVGDHSGPNCLATVGGVTLIERTLAVLEAIGIRQVAITTGWRGRRAARRDRRLDAHRAGDQAKHHLLRQPALGQAQRALGAGGAHVPHRADAAGDGRPDRGARAAARAGARAVAAATAPCCASTAISRACSTSRTRPRCSSRGDVVRAIGKDLRQYQAVSAGLFVMSPTLLAALDSLAEPSLTQGVRRRPRAGWSAAHDVGTKLWQDVDSPAMKAHADWLLRVYGDELARPSVPAAPHSHAGDTLALVERLLAEKDLPGPRAVQPRAGHDVGAREGGAGAPRRLPPRRGLLGGRRAPAVQAAAGVRRVARARDAAAHGLGHGGDGDGDLVGDPRGEEDPGRQQRRVRRSPRRDRGAARHRARRAALPVGRAARSRGGGARAGERSRHRGRGADPPRDVGRPAQPGARDRAALPRARRDADRRRGVGAGRRGRRRRARPRRHLLLVGQQVPALGVGRVVPVRRARGLVAHRRRSGRASTTWICKRHRRYLEELRQTPFTPAVSSFFALETALDELAESGGVPARRDVYRKRACASGASSPISGSSRSRTRGASRTRSRRCGCPTS